MVDTKKVKIAKSCMRYNFTFTMIQDQSQPIRPVFLNAAVHRLRLGTWGKNKLLATEHPLFYRQRTTDSNKEWTMKLTTIRQWKLCPRPPANQGAVPYR